MTTDTISNHIATIQTLAAELTEAQHDQQRLDSIAEKIHLISGRLLETEDAYSRLAKTLLKRYGKKTVSIKELSLLVGDGHNPQAHECMLRYFLQIGTIPGIHKSNRQWCCTYETLAAYLRDNARQEAQCRQRQAEAADLAA